MTTALITGITGQDGSYLAEWLLDKGYDVHGLVRRETFEDESRLWRIKPVMNRLTLHQGDMENGAALLKTIGRIKPDECYHLAAESFVSYAFESGSSTLSANINGALAVLTALRDAAPQCRVYFAGSSEMFGLAETSPQDERTRFHPRSLYGISKVAGYHLMENFRRSHGVFACCGFLYNHESPRRGSPFVTRKICRAAVEIRAGLVKELRLGNLAARRDWGFAGDYVRAMWLMLQQDAPDDYVVATGRTHTVEEFVAAAFERVGLDWKQHVVVDEKFFRPAEPVVLTGNADKIRRKLGWAPDVEFDDLVGMMVDAEEERLNGGRGDVAVMGFGNVTES